MRVIFLRVHYELLYGTDFSECSNVFLSLKEQRILILLWAQYCKILAGALTRQITERLLLVLIFTKRLVVEMLTQLTFLEEVLNMRIPWRAGSAYPS